MVISRCDLCERKAIGLSPASFEDTEDAEKTLILGLIFENLIKSVRKTAIPL